MTAALETRSADLLMAHAGKTFHRAARLLPASVREDVVRLYAFCRRVDDLADEPGRDAEERGRALGELAAAFARRDLPALREAGWSFPAHGAMAEAARQLLAAAAEDVHQQQPHTEQELLAYSFGVAGTVGIMMAEVLRARPAGLRAAVALGMAMQLSNIARDVAEDLANDRVYLPSAWVRADILRSALDGKHSADAHQVLAATARLLALAETLYEVAFEGIGSLPWRLRWSILAAALCYREIGREVGRRGRLSWTRRVVISSRRKLWLIAAAGVRLLSPRFWSTRLPHTLPILGTSALTSIRRMGLA